MTGEDTTTATSNRILVVDDNEMSRAVIERRLTKDGHDVILASSGEEALKIVESGPVGLIFLDVVMDGIGGMEVLIMLKADDRLRNIPVVMVSGIDETDMPAIFTRAGAADFLHKPVMAKTLQAVVADLLGGGTPAESGGDGAGGGTGDGGPSVADAPLLDPAYIGQLLSDYGKETTAGFIERFQDLAPGQRDAIAEAASAGDAERLRRAAHDLKGGARTLGLGRLAAVCRDIERATDATATEGLNDHFDAALTALKDHAEAM